MPLSETEPVTDGAEANTVMLPQRRTSYRTNLSYIQSRCGHGGDRQQASRSEIQNQLDLVELSRSFPGPGNAHP